MKRSMPPISLAIYRLLLAVGTILILFGVMMAADVLAGTAPLGPNDLWMPIIPFGVGVLFTLQALLRRRFLGIREDNAPDWAQIVGTLGLAFLAAFGGNEWLDDTFGNSIGSVVFMVLFLLALSAPTWLLPSSRNDKVAKGD